MESTRFIARKYMSVNHDRVKELSFLHLIIILCSRSQWPCDLRRGYAADRLFGMWVRIPPGAGMSSSCGCCVLSGRGFCVGLITCPENSYRLLYV